MTKRELSKATCVDYGVAARPLAGQDCSGDGYFVRESEGEVRLAVIDGLGHGLQAADAAATAIKVLENNPDLTLVQLIEVCHGALKQKRGVAMTVVSMQSTANQLVWVGVGNICGSLFIADRSEPRWKSMPPQSGIVGYQLPRLQLGRAAIAPGDWLVLATDGVRIDFGEGMAVRGPLQEIAARILTRHYKGNDDALVLTARYLGKGDE